MEPIKYIFHILMKSILIVCFQDYFFLQDMSESSTYNLLIYIAISSLENRKQL